MKVRNAAEPHRSKPQKNPKKNISSNHILIFGEEIFNSKLHKIMRSHYGFKLAIPYLLITVGITIWIMTKSGDTPILPALFILLPWGFMFSEQFKGMEFGLPLVNISLNGILLYILGRIFEKFTSLKK